MKDALTLWYKTPASLDHRGWEEEALPIGNGDLGCKIFGGMQKERIHFNEKSLWSGTVLGENNNSNGNKNGDFGKSLKLIQNLLKEGKTGEAAENMQLLQGDEIGLGAYQSFGDLFLEFVGLNENECSQYERGLSMDNALAWTEFVYKGERHRREYFVSCPAKVAVIQMSGMNMEVLLKLELHQEVQHIVWSEQGMEITGRVPESNLKFALSLYVKSDGKIEKIQEGVRIFDASDVCIYIAAATDYGWEYPRYRNNTDLLGVVSKRTEEAAAKSYESLKQEHEKDFSELFERVSLDIGQERNSLPTDKLLQEYQNGKESRLLEYQMFQYGRYLILSSSRAGGLPANLQGVWNDSNTPAWQSDYHLNINLQMNYWLSLNTNLSETMPPLVDYVNKCLVIPGRETAWRYTGIGDGDANTPTGWMAHTQNNIFGHTGPGSDWRWGWAPTVGAFLLQNTYEYFRFARDFEYLEKEIYPAMEECGRLWSQLLIRDENTGELLCSPCFSPEHGPVTAGNAFDQTMIWQVYHDILEAAEELAADGREKAVDWELIHQIKEQFLNITPCTVGDWGQIREWREEDEWENRGEKMGVQIHHRHFSHLMGVYPGQYITQNKPELMRAAEISMKDRGEEGPSWSLALRIGVWSRLLNGNQAYHALKQFISHNTMSNLWGFHPPFQIDGNFGLSAGIGEMLLQSHDQCIHVLPALPDCWKKKGRFRGLKARGNVTVNTAWENGRVCEIQLYAGSDYEFCLQYPGGKRECSMKKGEIIFIDMNGGVL